MNKIALYPGSFDPITKGHLNIIKRARGSMNVTEYTYSLAYSFRLVTPHSFKCS